jgi:hypothetical protein
MQTLKIILLLACIILTNTANAGIPEIKASNNQLSWQAMSLNMDYAERDDSGVLLDTETGPVQGNMFTLSLMRSNANVYFQAQYSRNEGRSKYVGGLIGPPSTPYGSVVSTSGATITNYSFRLGKGFELGRSSNASNDYLLTPYVELGMQEWYRGVNAGETYSHKTYGAGLLWQISSSGSKFVTSINGLIGQTFGSYIDVTGYFSGALGSSPLYKAGLNFDYAFTKFLHGNFGLDYVNFAYGKSAVYSGYLEPDSTSTYLMYKAGLGIAF